MNFFEQPVVDAPKLPGTNAGKKPNTEERTAMDSQFDEEQNIAPIRLPGLGQTYGREAAQQDNPAPVSPVETGGAPVGVPLRILRWLEWHGLALDRAAIRKEGAGDTWWLCQNEEMHGPFAFGEIITALVGGAGAISIVQNARAQDEVPPWRNLSYKPLWSRRWIAVLWTVAFWGICGALGFGVAQLFLPFGTPIRFFGIIAYWVLFAALLASLTLRRPAKSKRPRQKRM
jgi:hypothetical protein